MNAQRILLPVDGSSHSDNAAAAAIEIAKHDGASVVLLHVRRPVPTGLGQPNADELLDHLTKGAEAVMDIYRPQLDDAGLDVTDLIIGGGVAEVIANVADVEKCDLIVMGSKGKSEIHGLILGSVTHRTLQLATCPVLVVK